MTREVVEVCMCQVREIDQVQGRDQWGSCRSLVTCLHMANEGCYGMQDKKKRKKEEKKREKDDRPSRRDR